MNKWTREQRQKAIRDTEAMMMASDRATAVESYNDAAIELACQRNELLEALKACHLQMLQSNNDSEYAQEANQLAIAAISKAEGK